MTWQRCHSAVRALLLLSALVFPAGAAERSAFGPGEQLTYDVSYLGVTAGWAQVTVGATMQQYGAEVWPIVCLAKTTSLADMYPVRDRFISFWEPRQRRSVGSDFFQDENGKRRRERVRIDATERKAFVTRQREGATAEVSYDLNDAFADVAGAMLYLRNETLQEGHRVRVPVFTGDNTFVMEAVVEARQTIRTVLGDREVFRLRVSSDFSGKLKTKRDMQVYLTADAAQVPVRVEADFLLGTLRAELSAYSSGRDYTQGGL
ncbi:MAG: DUF3108 domain-containing protein [Myxococcaceae bacterium]|nr:DUF3108 domain-containing protein [Myxococcaceae bacterium]